MCHEYKMWFFGFENSVELLSIGSYHDDGIESIILVHISIGSLLTRWNLFSYCFASVMLNAALNHLFTGPFQHTFNFFLSLYIFSKVSLELSWFERIGPTSTNPNISYRLFVHLYKRNILKANFKISLACLCRVWLRN